MAPSDARQLRLSPASRSLFSMALQRHRALLAPATGRWRMPQEAARSSPTRSMSVARGLVRRWHRRAWRGGPSAQTVGSVVIPAHNEANVIGRGLDRLFGSLGTGIEVIVVCNGCTDDTADTARAWRPSPDGDRAGCRLEGGGASSRRKGRYRPSPGLSRRRRPRDRKDDPRGARTPPPPWCPSRTSSTRLRHLVELVDGAAVLPGQDQDPRSDGLAVGCGDVHAVGRGSPAIR